MGIIWIISLFVFLIGVPVLSKWLCGRYRFFEVLGPVVVCYLFGLAAVNLGAPFALKEMTESVTHAAVPLAIILLLLSSDFRVWKKVAGGAGLSFLFVFLSVFSASLIGYQIFRNQVSEPELMAGMLTGVYTGGTANMAAVSMALGAPPELFGLLNMYDVVLGGSYLLFVMTLARPLYGLILPVKKELYDSASDSDWMNRPATPGGVVFSLLIAVAVLGIVVGLSLLIFKRSEASFIIPGITVLAVASSFIPRVRNLPGSFAAGDFFLLMFGTGMGLMSDFRAFEGKSWETAAFMASVLVISMLIHIILAALFRLDRDTVIITSAAGVMSPPFVPAIARSLKNTAVILPGMAAGILGNAAGNLLGIMVAKWLGG